MYVYISDYLDPCALGCERSWENGPEKGKENPTKANKTPKNNIKMRSQWKAVGSIYMYFQ